MQVVGFCLPSHPPPPSPLLQSFFLRHKRRAEKVDKDNRRNRGGLRNTNTCSPTAVLSLLAAVRDEVAPPPAQGSNLPDNNNLTSRSQKNGVKGNKRKKERVAPCPGNERCLNATRGSCREAMRGRAGRSRNQGFSSGTKYRHKSVENFARRQREGRHAGG